MNFFFHLLLEKTSPPSLPFTTFPSPPSLHDLLTTVPPSHNSSTFSRESSHSLIILFSGQDKTMFTSPERSTRVPATTPPPVPRRTHTRTTSPRPRPRPLPVLPVVMVSLVALVSPFSSSAPLVSPFSSSAPLVCSCWRVG